MDSGSRKISVKYQESFLTLDGPSEYLGTVKMTLEQIAKACSLDTRHVFTYKGQPSSVGQSGLSVNELRQGQSAFRCLLKITPGTLHKSVVEYSPHK